MQQPYHRRPQGRRKPPWPTLIRPTYEHPYISTPKHTPATYRRATTAFTIPWLSKPK